MNGIVSQAYDAAAPHYDGWAWQGLWRRWEHPWLRRQGGWAIRVVSLGVGTGGIVDALPASQHIGVDVSSAMLRIAVARHPSLRIIEADARSVPLPDGIADLVVCTRVLSHLPDAGPLLREARRLLRRGGMLLASDIHPRHAYERTRVPTSRGKVEVPTWKHDPSSLVGAGWHHVRLQALSAAEAPGGPALAVGAGHAKGPLSWRLMATAG